MIIQLPIGMLDSNCYIVYDHDGGEGAIVDPGVERPDPLLEQVDEHGLAVSYILNTHGHFDHVLGNSRLSLQDARLAVHRADRALLLAGGGAPMFGLPHVASPDPAVVLEDGMVLGLGDLAIEVIHTPGHTEGSVCFYIPADAAVITGDTLFAGSVGRTDLPGGSHATLMESLAKLAALPDETVVFPGHGPATTIGRERQKNPYLQHLTPRPR